MNVLFVNYIIVHGLIGIIPVSLGFFVLLKNPRSLIYRYFFLYNAAISWWGFCTVFMELAPNASVALFWDRVELLSIVFIPTLTLAFILEYSSKRERFKYLLQVTFLISSIFFALCFTPLMAKSVSQKSFVKYFTDPGPAYHLFMVFFPIVMICTSIFLYRTHLIYKKERRGIGLLYLLVVTVIATIGGGANFLVPYVIVIPYLIPFGSYTLVLYVAVAAYVILKYSLLDINIVVARATIFSFVYLVVLGLPFGIGYKLLGSGLWTIPLIAMAIFATAGPFVFTYFRRKAENRLRKEEFQAHQALNKLAQDMMRFTKLETLLKLIVHHVVKIMKVYSASIYLRDEGNKHYLLRAAWGPDNPPPPQSEFLEDASLVKDILLRRVPVVTEELSFGRTSKISSHLKRLQLELHKAKAAVVIPAFKGDYLFGFLMLGARKDKRLFTQDDLNLLMLLANQSVLAIENAQLFEKEKTFLAEKSRRDALADMAPGVAHQFNNRLAAIIASADAQMALNELEDITKLSPEKLISLIKDSQNTLNIIEKEALRGKDIANAILKKGKAKLAYIKTDLVPIIQSAIDLLRVSRTRTSLEGTPEPEIILDVEENLPQLILNESLIQDVFYNLIDNARDAIIIKYKAINENKITPEITPYKGKITITLAKKDDKAVVTVHDNGIGMDEKTKARLFVPYFTTKATSLKGTGMGLWVIRSFIEDHKGRISFESEYAKGTTFAITFPIKEA